MHQEPITLATFLRWREALQARVSIEVAFIDMCEGSHIAALMLSLLVAEHQKEVHRSSGGPMGMGPPSEAKWIKGVTWLPMPWARWWATARIAKRTGMRALNHLIQLGYVRKKVMMPVRGEGARTCLYVSLNEDPLMRSWARVLSGSAPLFSDPECSDL